MTAPLKATLLTGCELKQRLVGRSGFIVQMSYLSLNAWISSQTLFSTVSSVTREKIFLKIFLS